MIYRILNLKNKFSDLRGVPDNYTTTHSTNFIRCPLLNQFPDFFPDAFKTLQMVVVTFVLLNVVPRRKGQTLKYPTDSSTTAQSCFNFETPDDPNQYHRTKDDHTSSAPRRTVPNLTAAFSSNSLLIISLPLFSTRWSFSVSLIA